MDHLAPMHPTPMRSPTLVNGDEPNKANNSNDDASSSTQQGELGETSGCPWSFPGSLICLVNCLFTVIVDCIRARVAQPSPVPNCNPVPYEPRPTRISMPVPSPYGSEQPQTSIEKPEAVRVSFEAKPRLFALLIGINVYEHAGAQFSNLKGAVADAEDMFEFLTTTLDVDPSHIRCLRDREATRRGIISAFSALTSDERIQRGDAIVIFYSGHGSRAQVGTGGKSKFHEMIIPYDFLPSIPSDVEQQGILDITLDQLLWKLARQKSNNITVIFDSCHSGTGTRNLDLRTHLGSAISQSGDLRRGFKLEGYILPREPTILTLSGDKVRNVEVPPGYTFFGSESHMLLAACREDEYAWESAGRGFFTKALLALLRDVDPYDLTYSDLIQLLPDRDDQHPQCAGNNSACALFHRTPPSRRYLYPVTVTKIAGQEQQVTLGGGEVHGVTKGAEFDVFATRDSKARPLCRLVVRTTDAISADLGPLADSVEQELPQKAWARQTVVGQHTAFMVAVRPRPEFEALRSTVARKCRNKRPIQFVDPDSRQPYELELQIQGDNIVFVVADTISTTAGLTKLPALVPLNNVGAIYAALESAADFFFHLRHRPNLAAWPAPAITTTEPQTSSYCFPVVLEAFQLAEDRTPSGHNLVEGGVLRIEIMKTKDRPWYGFRLHNHEDYNVYVWVFMFRMSDFAIEVLYQPNSAKSPPDGSLPAGQKLELGWGADGVAPRQFVLPEGINADVTYLKVYVTSDPVDLSHITQCSPFRSRHRSIKAMVEAPEPPLPPFWDTMVVPIVQKAAEE